MWNTFLNKVNTLTKYCVKEPLKQFKNYWKKYQKGTDKHTPTTQGKGFDC